MVCNKLQPRATSPKENKNEDETAATQPAGCLVTACGQGNSEFMTVLAVLAFERLSERTWLQLPSPLQGTTNNIVHTLFSENKRSCLFTLCVQHQTSDLATLWLIYFSNKIQLNHLKYINKSALTWCNNYLTCLYYTRNQAMKKHFWCLKKQVQLF